MQNTNKLFHIAYFLYIENPSKKCTEICENLESELELLPLLEKIALLPIDIIELFKEDGEAFIHRIRLLQNTTVIQKISDLNEIINSPFDINIVLTKKKKQQNEKYIVISMDDETNISHKTININEITYNNIYLCIQELHNFLSPQSKANLDELKEQNSELSGLLYNKKTMPKIINNNIFGDDTEEENYNLLKCLFKEEIINKCKTQNESSLDFLIKLKSYYTQQLLGNDNALQFLTQKNDFIIKDNSYNLEFNANKAQYTQNGIKDITDNPEQMHAALKVIRSIDDSILKKQHNNIYIDNYILESKFKKIAIRFYALLTYTPILKSSLTNKSVFTYLDDIALQCRDKQKNISKYHNSPSPIISQRIKTISKEMEQSLGDNIKYLNNKDMQYVKIFSHLPIEFMNVERIPLMIRHNVSKIPPTPGHLFSKCVYGQKNIFFTEQSFKTILIISSFSDDDHLQNDLQTALDAFNFDQTSLKIIQIRVKNNNELEKALQNNKCDFLILNMHGGHGALQLTEELIDIEIFKDHTPPIVLLSACDTSSIDENHFSIANHFLSFDAQCVIASALPIISIDSAEFIGRLLYRISVFIKPTFSSIPMNFLEIVAGMQRRKYFSDLLALLNKEHKKASNSKFMEKILLLVDGEHDINQAIEEIAKYFNIKTNELYDFIENDYYLPETLKYTLLGSPENILFVDSKKIPLI